MNVGVHCPNCRRSYLFVKCSNCSSGGSSFSLGKSIRGIPGVVCNSCGLLDRRFKCYCGAVLMGSVFRDDMQNAENSAKIN
jgi:hypothetical protein